MNRLRLVSLVAAALACASSAAAQVWEVGNHLLTLPGGSVAESQFGWALVAGDFDGDGRDDDLVVRSSPGGGPGRIDLYLGSPAGPSAPAGGSVTSTSAVGGFGVALVAGDFDSDPADELAVGASLADVTVGKDLVADAGLVQIFNWTGAAWSLAATFSQQTANVPGGSEAEDWFGFALAAGDFDDDGFDDLAIGVPLEDAGANSNGAVNVLYGASAGLGTEGAQIWYRGDEGGIAGTPEDFATLGWSLASGDFDSDGVTDLAIGLPGQDVDAVTGTGEVVVLFGIAAIGLASADQQDFDPTDLGEDADGQAFGQSLAAGDLNSSFACAFFGTCADDLVVGAPATDALNPNSGQIWVVPGSESVDGLDPALANPFTQANFDPFETTLPELSDSFGSRLAVGPLDGTGGVDLVVGTRNEAFESIQEAGCVHAISGGSLDLATSAYQFLYARSGFAAAPVAEGQRFGEALAIGDFDEDGWGDLAIAVPGKTVSGQDDAGAVQILYGSLFADGFEIGDESAWETPP